MASDGKIPTIKNNHEIKPASRRELLKSLSLAGVVATSPAAFTGIPGEAEQVPPARPRATYVETEHIRTFYALARR